MVMKVLHLPVLFLDKTVHLFQHHVSHASNEQKKYFTAFQTATIQKQQ